MNATEGFEVWDVRSAQAAANLMECLILSDRRSITKQAAGHAGKNGGRVARMIHRRDAEDAEETAENED